MIRKIAKFLKDEEVYVVGGAVRDRLLKRPLIDIDLVIDRKPDQMGRQIAKKFGGTAFPLDEKRGITRVVFSEDFYVDIALRQGPTFNADIDRRDFTINALSVPLQDWIKPAWKKKIMDRHHGLKDIKNKKITSLNGQVLKEDPLRLLRAIRIGAEVKFNINPKTLTFISQYKDAITQCAPERIREEMMKLFSTHPSFAYIKILEKTGLLEVLFPETKDLRKTAPKYYGKGGVMKHVMSSVDQFEKIQSTLKSWFPKNHKKISQYLNEPLGNYPRFAHLKWALLLHDIGKPDTAKIIKGRLRFFNHEHVGADKIPALATRYRWSNEQTNLYGKMVRNHMRPGNLANHTVLSDKAIHRFFRDLGDDAISMLLVSLGDHLTYLTPRQLKARNSPHELVTIKMINQYFKNPKKILPPKILSGHDVMKEFDLDPSPIIGALLKDLTEAQSEGKITNKKQALDYLRKKIQDPGSSPG